MASKKRDIKTNHALKSRLLAPVLTSTNIAIPLFISSFRFSFQRTEAQTATCVTNEFCFSGKINLDARELFNLELSTKLRFLEPNKRQFEINLEAYILRIHLSKSFLTFCCSGSKALLFPVPW